MHYLSVCSGIEAATTAWHELGWTPVGFSEIDPFAYAVLAHHYPATPNLGDMSRFLEWSHAPFDLLVGGTPCQSFSVAGLRRGLADPRGNLMLVYLAILGRYRPTWMVWENVPGVLSSGHGRDFGTFLGALAELGYGFAYRVLDAQFFGVAQRRRRVFVVGHLGDWRRAAAVLFERHSLSGHPPPRREAGQNAPTIPSRRTAGGGLGTDFDCDGGLIPSIANPLTARMGKGINTTCDERQTMIASRVTPPLTGNPHGDHVSREGLQVAHTLRADGFDVSEDGTGRGTPLVPVAPTLDQRAGRSGANSFATSGGLVPMAFDLAQITNKTNCMRVSPELPSGTLNAAGQMHVATSDMRPCVAFSVKDYGADAGAIAPTLRAGGHANSHANGGVMPAVHSGMAVRRLTPRECERLQGFPDDYTLIPYRGKPAADGPRYKALGNSMAVPVMRWIGRRIQYVEDCAE